MNLLRAVFTVALLLRLAVPSVAAAGTVGDEARYAAATISPLLRLNAAAVVRWDVQSLTVKNRREATWTVHRVVTILDATAEDESRLELYYDRFRKVDRLEGALYDATGKQLRKLKKDDVIDVSLSGFDNSLASDGRLRAASLSHTAYPYTVEFTFEVDYKGMVNWPDWSPQAGGLPVERASFQVELPRGESLRYLDRGLKVEPTVTTEGDRSVYRWAVALLPALQGEPMGPTWEEQAGRLLIAPTQFELDGNAGNMADWGQFGEWVYGLFSGRDGLPPEKAAEIRALVADAPSEREKVRRIYEHLQRTTRYISIQLGIGGMQPFPAQDVVSKGYGDCKALTNYMGAMLKTAGVASFPVLIQAGERAPEMVTSFSSNQFNHVILSVPTERDTLWLECTSQTQPFGQLGLFTESRHGLMLTPTGGKVVRTPTSNAAANLQHRTATVVLGPSGDATAQVVTHYRGWQADRVRGRLAHASERERLEWLHQTVDVPTFRVVKADFKSIEAARPDLTVPVELTLPKFAARTGSRLFLRPNLMERWGATPEAGKGRTQPVRLPFNWLDVDSIRYTLPTGFKVESQPEPVALETPFGQFAARFDLKDGELLYVRRLEMRRGTFPASQYDAYRKFVQTIVQTDRAQIVLATE